MGVPVPSFAPSAITEVQVNRNRMQTKLETLSQLERRLTMVVPADAIDREVENRLKKLSRTVRMPGFRPGKVPVKLVTQQYGPQVRSEGIGDAGQKAFEGGG